MKGLRAGRRAERATEHAAVQARREILEALTQAGVVTPGHLILASRAAVRACIRRDKRTGQLAEHRKVEKEMGTSIPVPTLMPEGSYGVRVESIGDPVPSNFGPRLQFTFTIMTSDYAGQTINGMATAIMTPRSKLRSWAEALLGRKLEPGEPFNTDMLLGKKAKAVVIHRTSDQGGVFANIDKLFKVGTATPAASVAKPAEEAPPVSADEWGGAEAEANAVEDDLPF